jgi:hypothetical protein
LWKDGGARVPWGLIWYAPASPNYQEASHPEYHWAGLQLIAGNLYLLTGFVLLAAAAALAMAAHPRHKAARVHSVAGYPLPADPACQGSATPQGRAVCPGRAGLDPAGHCCQDETARAGEERGSRR